MRLRFVLIGLFFAVATVGVCAKSYLALTSPMFFTTDDYGFGVRQQVGRLVVGPITSTGSAATLQTGDEFVSLDGENIRYQTDLISTLDAVLQKCLAKDRERRFSSAGEMQRELIPAIREYRLVGTQKWSGSEADTLLY